MRNFRNILITTTACVATLTLSLSATAKDHEDQSKGHTSSNSHASSAPRISTPHPSGENSGGHTQGAPNNFNQHGPATLSNNNARGFSPQRTQGATNNLSQRNLNNNAPRTNNFSTPNASTAHGNPRLNTNNLSGPAHGQVGNTALNHNESQTRLNQFNASRTGMSGINSHPLPAGQLTSHANGYNLRTAGGNQLGLRHDGSVSSFAGHGQTARFGANGHVAALHTSNMDVRNVRGARYITSVRPDHSLLVGTGRRGGYLERPYSFGGHSYLERSYAWGGHFYNRYFYPYRYHGLLLAGAIAAAYYAPHFYGWAYDPWAAPVAYRWGWAGAPWYGYYNNYFTPYPAYADGAAWLTDYAISENLSSAYDDEGPGAPGGGPAELGAVYSDGPADNYVAAPSAAPITPEIKAAISDEVRRQLAQEKAAAANPNAVSQTPLLQDSMKPGNVFVVSSNLNVATTDQKNCTVTRGDSLQLQNAPAANDTSAVLRVASTKKGDCPVNSNVQLSLQNLADMQNDLRMQIDSGLATLQQNQGKDGLPAAPADALTPAKPVIVDNSNAGSANDVQALLDAQRKQADQAEEQVSQNALSGT